MTLQVESPTVYTSQGVPISVTGIAQVRVIKMQQGFLPVKLKKKIIKT
jgi:flotillin